MRNKAPLPSTSSKDPPQAPRCDLLRPPPQAPTKKEPLFCWQALYNGFRGWGSGGLGLLCLFLLLPFWQCTGKAQCQYDSDCSGDNVCQQGRCRPFVQDGNVQRTPCRHDTDCPGSELCVSGWCTPSGVSVERPVERPFEPSPPTEQPLPDGSPPETPPSDSPSESPPDSLPDGPQEAGPPPELGPTPLLHVMSSGGALSTTTSYKHFGLVGQACPLVPASTVMRSSQYSARVGFISVSVW